MDNTSIKETILNMIKEMNIEQNYNIWLFYLPIVNRDIDDFKRAFRHTKQKKFRSMCSFYEADYKYHPFFHGRSLEIKSLSSLKMIFIGDKIYLKLIITFIILAVLKFLK